MPDIVGIRFKSCGKIYYFNANGLTLQRGVRVIIESDFGLSFGTVVEAPHAAGESPKELKKVLRIASEEDFRQKTENDKFEQEARIFCHERVMARGLPMKLVRAEATLDRKKIIFYFTADGRIDFRELVKDLAARFRTRIEMRQIGVRDKAKLVGGFGLCGQELCCRSFLTSFEPISIKMAKQQDLTLNTGKLSGSCGRLMCCLGYEYSDSPHVQRTAEAGEEPPQQEAASPDLTEELSGMPGTEEEVPEEAPEKTVSTEASVQKQEPSGQGQPHKRRRRRRPRKRVKKIE